MKLALRLAHWCGGGLDAVLDLEVDDFVAWIRALQEVYEEDDNRQQAAN